MQKLKSASFFRNDDVIVIQPILTWFVNLQKMYCNDLSFLYQRNFFNKKKFHHVRNLRKKPGHNLNSEDFLLCKDSKLSVSYQYFLFKLVNTTYQKRSNFPRKTFTLLRIKVRLFYRRKPTTI